MNDRDYVDILKYLRMMMKEFGLSAVDERIMTDLRGSGESFGDLMQYLKYLTDVIALGSDVQLSNVLRRFRRYVQVESGETIEGIRVMVSDEDRERYDMKQFDLAPNEEFGKIAQEIVVLMDELIEDQRQGLDGQR